MAAAPQQTQHTGQSQQHAQKAAGESLTQGTIRPFPNFDANADADALEKAMAGKGCDERAVMNILCMRSLAQRIQIRDAYKKKYQKDLIKQLIAELKGNFEDLIVALLYTPDEYDATSLRNATQGIGTKESTLIEILCSRSHQEILAIAATYKRLFQRDLAADIKSETSGDMRPVLLSMCQTGRDEGTTTDPAKAAADAQKLFSAGEKVRGTDESVFHSILCSQNSAQLRLLFAEYQKLTKHDIEVAIKKEFTGDGENAYLAVVRNARNQPQFFAERLYNSMKGLGTKDNQLIRVLVTRCEVDLVQVKQEYQKAYGKSLEAAIADDTSGKYKDALVAIVKGN
jgi:annexin A7/11